MVCIDVCWEEEMHMLLLFEKLGVMAKHRCWASAKISCLTCFIDLHLQVESGTHICFLQIRVKVDMSGQLRHYHSIVPPSIQWLHRRTARLSLGLSVPNAVISCPQVRDDIISCTRSASSNSFPSFLHLTNHASADCHIDFFSMTLHFPRECQNPQRQGQGFVTGIHNWLCTLKACWPKFFLPLF